MAQYIVADGECNDEQYKKKHPCLLANFISAYYALQTLSRTPFEMLLVVHVLGLNAHTRVISYTSSVHSSLCTVRFFFLFCPFSAFQKKDTPDTSFQADKGWCYSHDHILRF